MWTLTIPESGFDREGRITAARLPTHVLVLTTFDLDQYVYEAMRAGASGFLLQGRAPRAARHRSGHRRTAKHCWRPRSLAG